MLTGFGRHRDKVAAIAAISAAPHRRRLGLYRRTDPRHSIDATAVIALLRELLRHPRWPGDRGPGRREQPQRPADPRLVRPVPSAASGKSAGLRAGARLCGDDPVVFGARPDVQAGAPACAAVRPCGDESSPRTRRSPEADPSALGRLETPVSGQEPYNLRVNKLHGNLARMRTNTVRSPRGAGIWSRGRGWRISRGRFVFAHDERFLPEVHADPDSLCWRSAYGLRREPPIPHTNDTVRQSLASQFRYGRPMNTRSLFSQAMDMRQTFPPSHTQWDLSRIQSKWPSL